MSFVGRDVRKMRVMIDTNILYSTFFFPNSKISKMVDFVQANHHLVLCKYVINEMIDLATEDYEHLLKDLYVYINTITDEVFEMEGFKNNNYPTMRDPKDVDVLVNAIESEVDILITGDKDFEDIKVDKPRILKPREFMDEYMG